VKINKAEKELLKNLTFLHLKRCNVTQKEKLDLTTSVILIQSFSPLIRDDYFKKILEFLSKNPNLLSFIQEQCNNSSLYRQPIIYLLYYLRVNYRGDFQKYWNFEEKELQRIENDVKKIKFNF